MKKLSLEPLKVDEELQPTIESVVEPVLEPVVKAEKLPSLTERILYILQLDKKSLDPDEEIKRKFGVGALRAAASDNPDPQHRRIIPQNPQRKLLLSGMPSIYWPALSSSGLALKRVAGTKHLCEFKHSDDFMQLQYQFFNFLETHNTPALHNFLHMNPSHISTLVMLAYSATQVSDFNTAGDLIKRALYVFEKSLYGELKLLSALDCGRLRYEKYCNRAFFLALFLHCYLLQRRGCWRTAFEVSKLVLRLTQFDEPEGDKDDVNEDDPMGMLFQLDTLAIRSGEFKFVEDAYILFVEEKKFQYLDVSWSYSRALSLFMKEQEEAMKGNKKKGKKVNCELTSETLNELHRKSADLLRTAVSRFPVVLQRLFQKNDSVLRADLEFSGLVSNDLELLTDLYVFRSWSLWKSPEVIQWVNFSLEQTLLSSSASPSFELQVCVYRHVYLTDWLTTQQSATAEVASMSKYIPKHFLDKTTPWGQPYTQLADPLPPFDLKRPVVYVEPYDKYFKKLLLQKNPYVIVPLMLQNSKRDIDEELDEIDIYVNELPPDLQQLIKDSKKTENATSVSSILSDFVSSFLPWRSLGFGANYHDQKIVDIPGLAEFVADNTER